MTLLFTLLTLAVLGVIAAVATGRIVGGLEEPSTSLASRGLPEGPVTPQSLGAVRFSPALRGYRMEEVDAVLDRLGDELASRDQRILELAQELRLAERAYVQRAARGAATPDWSTPADTASTAMTGAVPAAGSVGVNGHPDPKNQAHQNQTHQNQTHQNQGYRDPAQAYPGPVYPPQDRPAQAYSEQGRPAQGHADRGYPGPGHVGRGHPEPDQSPRSASRAEDAYSGYGHETESYSDRARSVRIDNPDHREP